MNSVPQKLLYNITCSWVLKQVMTKPYIGNKTRIYLENTFLYRKAEKFGLSLQLQLHCIFFLLRLMNLEQNNLILLNTPKIDVLIYYSFYSSFCLPSYCISSFFSLLAYNPFPLSSVVSMFLFCFLINLFFNCKWAVTDVEGTDIYS